MKTLKSFVEQSNIDESLIRAVVAAVGGWSAFKECASDVARYGAGGGTGGFIYYSDTVPFAAKNLKAIMAYCKELASDIGCYGAYSFIAGFNCMGPAASADDVIEAIQDRDHEMHTEVMNALAWFALEEVARSYVDLVGE